MNSATRPSTLALAEASCLDTEPEENSDD